MVLLLLDDFRCCRTQHYPGRCDWCCRLHLILMVRRVDLCRVLTASDRSWIFWRSSRHIVHPPGVADLCCLSSGLLQHVVVMVWSTVLVTCVGQLCWSHVLGHMCWVTCVGSLVLGHLCWVTCVLGQLCFGSIVFWVMCFGHCLVIVWSFLVVLCIGWIRLRVACVRHHAGCVCRMHPTSGHARRKRKRADKRVGTLWES